MIRFRLVLLLFLLGSQPLVRGAAWPQWRGPGRDGVATGVQLPAELPSQLPKRSWSTDIGEGYSSPVIVKGRLFILARPEEGKEACLCLDAATGKCLWRHTYSCSFRPPDSRAGRGPASTPTVDGDRVYMLGLGGMLHCLAIVDGCILWKHDFAHEYWGVKKDKDNDDAWFPSCGSAASPLIAGNLVVVSVGGEKAGALTAFDRRTGRLAWKALSDRSSYGSPLLTNLCGVRQLVGFTGLRMIGLRFSDQELLWEYPFQALYEQTVLTPVLWKDLVIFGGERKPVVALRLTEKEGAIKTRLAWQNPDLRPYLSTPVVMDSQLIGLDQRLNRLVAADLPSGKTAWSYGGLPNYASLVVAGRRLLVLSDDGQLQVLNVTADRAIKERKWRVAEDGTWAHLALVGNRIYVKDARSVLCYEIAGE